VAATALLKFLGVGHYFLRFGIFLFEPVGRKKACSTDLTMIGGERRDKSLSRRAGMGRSASRRLAWQDFPVHFAPDAKVLASANFRLEVGRDSPTQKQKVRYILKARRSSSAAVTVAEGALDTVEEAIASLARSTYQRGSASTHSSSTGREIKSLKRYVDALLGELLEVN
jgi:hypothetical protein